MSQFRKMVESKLSPVVNKMLMEAKILKVYNPGNSNYFEIHKEGIIRVIVNPSYSEYQGFKQNISNHEVRLIYGTDNNIYAWDANLAIHAQMMAYLEEQLGINIDAKVTIEDHADGRLYFDGYVEDSRLRNLFKDRLSEFERAMIVGKCVHIGARQGYIKFNTPQETQYAYKLLMDGEYEDYPGNYEFTLDDNDTTRINCEL